jgi:hypothetical protein
LGTARRRLKFKKKQGSAPKQKGAPLNPVFRRRAVSDWLDNLNHLANHALRDKSSTTKASHHQSITPHQPRSGLPNPSRSGNTGPRLRNIIISAC